MGSMMVKFLRGCVVVWVMALTTVSNFSLASEVPALHHVYLIFMENHSYQDIIGNPNAPFIQQSLKTANLATNY